MKAKTQTKTWAQANSTRAAKLFKAAKTIPEIAEAFGDRSRQNRVRNALSALGLYAIKHRKVAKKSTKR